MTSPDELLPTAACAATSSHVATRDIVQRAIHAGARAARHGTCLPLPALLDLESIFHQRGGQFPRFRSCPCAEAERYNQTLNQICERIDRCLLNQSSGDVVELDYLFVSSLHWGDAAGFQNQASPQDRFTLWRQAYIDWQDREDTVEKILASWRLDRPSDAAAWQHVVPQKPAQAHPRNHGVDPEEIWMLYDWYSGGRSGAEKFNHHVGQLYFDADDPQVLPDQTHRIRRLHRRLNAYQLPVQTTPEEQSRQIGAYPMSLLIKEPFDYLASSLINNWDPRLNKPPTSCPPTKIHLHLCWTSGLAAEVQRHRIVKEGPAQRRAYRRSTTARYSVAAKTEPDQSSTVETSYAATIQALAALLVDDLRSALHQLPVVVHLHRTASPALRGASVSTSALGTRWKEVVFGGGQLPKAEIMHLLFHRRLISETASRSPGFLIPEQERGFRLTQHHPAHWFCGIAWTGDFVGSESVGKIRFRPLMETRAGQSYQCPTSGLPEYLSHLILVDRADGRGGFYEIRRDHAHTRILPTFWGHSKPPHQEAAEHDPSFIALRTQTLDLVLDVLESRMR